MVLMIETTSEPSKATQNPLTEKPSMKEAANINSAALITKWKRPSVRIVIGKVNINNIGRTKPCSRPRITAAIMAAYRPTTSIPGIRYAANKSAKAPSNTRVSI